MGRITLVCTTHSEMGLCDENELLRIFETLDPDVIFEEIRPNDHGWLYRDKSKHTLEMRTICTYLKVRSARQVPVDGFVIPEGFHGDIGILFDYVESRSADYCAAITKINHMTFDLGFRYLNSQEFMALRKEADELFEKAIAISGNDHLKSLFSMWNEQLRRREGSMLENIYDFCRENSFTSGVFLVGAGHMSSIVKDIESRTKTEANLVEWHIWNGL